MFDYIIVKMRMYEISDQQYNPDIGHLCVSIYHQAAAGQSHPGFKVTYIYYVVLTFKQKKKNLNKPGLNYTNRKNYKLQATDNTHKPSGYHIYSIYRLYQLFLQCVQLYVIR